LGVWQENDQNDEKNETKNDMKMATVNTPKCKHLENEAKMHFTYLWQPSAHSNSISNNLVKLFSWAGH
jgi:recombination DNA repair RAD52 pathway protein